MKTQVELWKVGMFKECQVDGETFKVKGYTSIEDGQRIILENPEKIKVLDGKTLVEIEI